MGFLKAVGAMAARIFQINEEVASAHMRLYKVGLMYVCVCVMVFECSFKQGMLAIKSGCTSYFVLLFDVIWRLWFLGVLRGSVEAVEQVILTRNLGL